MPATAAVPAAPPRVAVPPSGAAFDALFDRLNGPDTLDMTMAAWDAALGELAARVPADDPARELKLRSLDCGHSRWGASPALARYVDRAMRVARTRGDLGSQARLALCLASYHALGGRTQSAIAVLGSAIVLARQVHDPLLAMTLLSYRGDLHSLLGNQARALIDYDQARQVLQGAGLQRLERFLLSGTGMIYRRMGEYTRALAEFRKLEASLPATATWEDHYVVAMQKGFLYTEHDQAALGVQEFTRALALARTHGEASERAAALTGLAQAQVGAGRYQAALDSIAQAEALDDSLLNATDHGVNQLVRGLARDGMGHPRAALALYDQALALLRGEGNPRYLAWLYQSRAQTQEHLGHDKAALSDFRRYTILQRSLDNLGSHQQGLLVQLQASARQRNLENTQLRQQQAFQQQRVDALLRVRRWQSTALALGLLLVATLAVLSLQLLRRTRQLRRIAMIDALTQLDNRRSIYAAADAAVRAAHATAQPLSALVVDVDHFKSINDRHGHPAGDNVLVALARCCQATLRHGDLIGRAGGEEFLILCPDTTLDAAHGIGDRLLEAVRALRFDAIDPALRVTISIGAASLRRGGSVDNLIAAADRALYAAKQGGRDRLQAEGTALPDAVSAQPAGWVPAPAL